MTLIQISQYIGFGGFILWSIVERGFHLTDQKQADGEKEAPLTFWLLNIFWYGAMLLSILDVWGPGWTEFERPIWGLQILGIFLVLIGITIRFLSRKGLGKQYSVHVATSQEHQLITNGIYQYLRHPAYLGLLCLFLGIPLAMGSWAGVLIALIGGIPAIIFRTNIEERSLTAWFGEDYEKYRQNTWGLIPYIW
jgi:protein-S-isoprenylcysteine O-methyltransferase Ste14